MYNRCQSHTLHSFSLSPSLLTPHPIPSQPSSSSLATERERGKKVASILSPLTYITHSWHYNFYRITDTYWWWWYFHLFFSFPLSLPFHFSLQHINKKNEKEEGKWSENVSVTVRRVLGVARELGKERFSWLSMMEWVEEKVTEKKEASSPASNVHFPLFPRRFL